MSPEAICSFLLLAYSLILSVFTISNSRLVSISKALALLLSWSLSSKFFTFIPVGICVTLHAESVLLTFWPPGPEARMNSNYRSLGSILKSMGISGMTMMMHVELCILPSFSVSGTHWTLWTPLSCFRWPKTSWPRILNRACLQPLPIEVSGTNLSYCICQPFYEA